MWALQKPQSVWFMYSKTLTTMKKILLFIAALAGMITVADAQMISDVAVSGVRIVKNGDRMDVEMKIDLSQLDVRNRRSVHLVPMLVNGADSVELSPIGIYSRGRYINYLRKGESVFEDLKEKVYKEGEHPDVVNYSASVPYAAWMDGSEAVLSRRTCGCCREFLSEENNAIGEYYVPVFDPHFIYIQPEAELVKMRELSGTAFVDFVVARTDIDPAYRNNSHELGKIMATIDSVRNDKDISVKSLYLKGYASPESPFVNNERLAKGRTEALKDYVGRLYDFNDDVIVTDFEPENWAGLRAYVETSDIIADKNGILSIIDSEMDPDAKEKKIRTLYPADYTRLVAECYPALRKTDYRIEYTIADFTDVEQIRHIFNTSPNKLSLNELYVASTASEPGSEEFIRIFETAVRMYPSDPVANLNAANVAVESGKYREAWNYLQKAGDIPEAEYARGLYYIATGNYDLAEKSLLEAKKAGIAESDDMLVQCAQLKKYYSENK